MQNLIVFLSRIAKSDLCHDAKNFRRFLPNDLWEKISTVGSAKLLQYQHPSTGVFDIEDALQNALLPDGGLFKIMRNFNHKQWQGNEYQGFLIYWTRSVFRKHRFDVIKSKAREPMHLEYQ